MPSNVTLACGHIHTPTHLHGQRFYTCHAVVAVFVEGEYERRICGKMYVIEACPQPVAYFARETSFVPHGSEGKGETEYGDV